MPNKTGAPQTAQKKMIKAQLPLATPDIGPDTSILDWRDRLVCSECGGCGVDFVLTGTERR